MFKIKQHAERMKAEVSYSLTGIRAVQYFGGNGICRPAGQHKQKIGGSNDRSTVR